MVESCTKGERGEGGERREKGIHGFVEVVAEGERGESLGKIFNSLLELLAKTEREREKFHKFVVFHAKREMGEGVREGTTNFLIEGVTKSEVSERYGER